MRIRSHIDPVTFVIFLHVDASAYDDAFRDCANSLKPARGTDVRPLFEMLKDRERRVIAHERYHFWQGLRLPFLHVYAMTTFRSAFVAVAEMARISEDWTEWPALVKSGAAFERLDQEFCLSGDGASGHLGFGAEFAPGSPLRLRFTAKDMLEGAASIFDYQAGCETIAEMSDIDRFRRWRKRNPAYLDLFDFLAAFLGSDRLVLRIMIPLVNACFHTSVPEKALFGLVAQLWKTFRTPVGDAADFLAQPEPCRWREVMTLFLRGLDFDLPWGQTPDTIDPMSPEFYWMDPDVWLGAQIGGGVQHPFLGPLATEWAERAKKDPGLDLYLDAPGYVSSEAAHEFAMNADPQLRIIRVFLDEGADRVFSIGDGLVGPAFETGAFGSFSESDFRAFVLHAMAVYGAFRRATGVHMTEAGRTCYHRDCPHYDGNFCNSYPLIPVEYRDCGFPERLRTWIDNIPRRSM